MHKFSSIQCWGKKSYVHVLKKEWWKRRAATKKWDSVDLAIGRGKKHAWSVIPDPLVGAESFPFRSS